MLQLYPSTQVDFTNNGDPIRHSFDERVIREDGFYLTFELLLDENKEYKKVQLENIIGAMTPDGMNYFKVYDVIPKTDHVEVIALQLFYYLDYRRIKPFNLKKSTGFGAIQALAHNFVSGIDPYTFDSSVNETHDFSVDTTGSEDEKYYNALEIANRIANRWDSEFMLNGYDVRMVKRLGKKTDALLYEKKNISEFEFENSARSLVTRIYAVSRWALDRDDPEFVEDADNEREIRVTVDSPLINEYSQIYEEEYTNNDLRTEQELINWASLKYSTDNVDKPSRSIELKANTVDGTEINYGDELVLKYLTHDIDETIRCVGYDFNPVTEDYYSVTLGDWRDSFGRSFNRQVADVSDRQQSQLDRLEREVQIVQMSANGKNRVTYGENPVPNPIDGDIWLYHPVDRPNEVELRIYNAESGQWERKDVSSEIIKQHFEEIDRIQQELIEDVEANENKVQQAIEDAGLAQVTAQTAQAEAESAKSSSSEALEKAILAVSDSETAKQNALDAVSQASTAKQNANEALGKAGEAVSKANDAIGKANQIPQDIQSEIESKGLVSGSWVESHVNDVTGEINYALSEVSGSIPTVILGVTWDKNENPILTRTDYVEEYAKLTDYLLKTNEIDYSIEGLSGRMSEVETKKLDSTEFTSFKTNDYDVTVEGFRTALTDKLDEETFSSFKTNEFDVTVEGINGSIESLQTEKLDEETFSSFKSNDYELTVDGLRMDLTSVSGSIPTVIMGVEWDKSQNPELTRTDYLEYDNPNLYSPGFIIGVRWDKTENPTLYRTDDTGGVDDYEYSQQTAQFVSDISGLSGRVENVESNKLGANEFNSFKTNTYDVDLAGLRTNITSLEEGKLGSDEFSNFKTNVFDVSVSGLSGRIGTVETEKLDSETYDSFKTNTYDVDVGGLKSRMSSVETNKLDSGTFNTFRDTTYSNTIDGITGSISALQEDKLDNQDFNSFKQNEYEVTVDGLRMGLTDVQGSFPTIVLGVEWDKSSDPELTRTDFSEIDNPNLYAPSFVMGVMWDKKESPTMYRVADTGGVGDYEFTALQADYNFTKENWSTRLSQIETAGYATQSWSNQTFATPQSVSTQLQSYAKTTDLNGMVTETLLEQRNYLTASQAEQTFVQAEMLDGEFVSVLSSGTSQTAQYIQDYVIGEDYLSEFIQTSDLFASRVGEIIEDDLSIGTQISQTKDMIELAFFGSNDDQISRLAVGESGIYLNGALIDLDGNAKFNDVFAQNVWAEGITASNVTAMSAQFGHAIINNLDVNSATVNKADFIEALFNGVRTRVSIHSDGMDVLRNDGSYSTRFIHNGLQIWRDGAHTGSIISLTPIGSGDTGWFQGKRSMSITGEMGTFISISMRNTNGNLGRLMAFNDQQKIRLYAPIYTDNNFTRGIQLKSATIGNKASVVLGSSDFYTESAIAFRNDGALLVRRPDNGQWINLPDEILRIRNRLNALEGSVGGGDGDGGTTTTYHTTKAGEYPSLIAEMYGITLQQLYNWNTWYTPGSVVKVGDRWRVS